MGKMHKTTVRSVKGVISKLCKIKPGFKVKRKDQPGDSFYKPKWWFGIHANESDLAKLDSGWGVVSDHTSWKLQFCYKPADSPNVTQPHEDVLEFPFIGVTPGETEQGLLLH